LQNGISCSPAHDYVHFKTKALEVLGKGAVVKLTYDKLSSKLPSTAEIQIDGRKTAPSVRAICSKGKLFKELYLHQAFDKAFT